MARPKRSGAAARVHDGDGDFNPTKKSPTKPKPTSPPNRNPSPRKGRKTEQQDTIDEGVAATSDDTSLQARVDKDGNIYEPSPQKVTTSTTTPLQTPLRKNAARNTPSRKTIVDQSSETFEAGQEGPASQADAAASSSSKSKIVVLKVAPHKLSEVIKAQTASNEDVNSKLAPTQLPPVKEEPVAGISVFPPLLQPEAPWPEEAPEMAPVKEKNAHDVLDSGFTRPFRCIGLYLETDHDHGRRHQGGDPGPLRHRQHNPRLPPRVAWSLGPKDVSPHLTPTSPSICLLFKKTFPTHIPPLLLP